jgi:hypothetical protein
MNIKKVGDNGYNYRVMEVNKLQEKVIKMLEEENARLKIQIEDRDKIIKMYQRKAELESEGKNGN